MKLRCPICNGSYDYREAVREGALLEVLRMVGDFAPHHRLVFEYMELFGTTRPMKTLKLRRVLGDVHEIFAKGEFRYQKRTYRISKAGAAEGLKAVCNRTFAEALTNHNYLKKVLISVAEKEEERRSIEREKELRRREAELRAGTRRGGPVKGHDDVDDGLPADIREITKKAPWREGNKDGGNHGKN